MEKGPVVFASSVSLSLNPVWNLADLIERDWIVMARMLAQGPVGAWKQMLGPRAYVAVLIWSWIVVILHLIVVDFFTK